MATELTEGERMVLLMLMEPFVFMPDGLLEPTARERVAELCRATVARRPILHPELA